MTLKTAATASAKWLLGARRWEEGAALRRRSGGRLRSLFVQPFVDVAGYWRRWGPAEFGRQVWHGPPAEVRRRRVRECAAWLRGNQKLADEMRAAVVLSWAGAVAIDVGVVGTGWMILRHGWISVAALAVWGGLAALAVLWSRHTWREGYDRWAAIRMASRGGRGNGVE